MTPTGRQNQHLFVAGLRTHYLEAGAGMPLVLLHGTAIDSARLSFGPSLPRLARHYHVLAPDWPGYGASEPPSSILSMSALSAFLGELLDALQLERCHLLGFSMGGAAALGFALARPERIQKLVLVGSYGLDARLHVPLFPTLALRTPLVDLPLWAALQQSPALLRLVVKGIAFGSGAVADELLHEVHQQLRVPGTRQTFTAWLKQELGWARLATSYARQLPELRVPTLLLHGARDLVVPVSRARRAARRIPRAQLDVFPGCGHWLPREAPEAFQRAVLEFLGSA